MVYETLHTKALDVADGSDDLHVTIKMMKIEEKEQST
jgi:hypothetical protein